MRRILALVLCVFLFAVPAHAANAAEGISSIVTVTENSACHVDLTLKIRLDEPARGLNFPLGTDIYSVTLNGTAAPLLQSGGMTCVDLSHLDGKTGLFTCSIRYTINSVVSTDEDGVQTVTVPLLQGFAFPVEQMDFSVTLPKTVSNSPTFTSGYHGQDIERQMTALVTEHTIQGSLGQSLKDNETLYMHLVASEGMFPASQTFGGTLGFDAAAMGICAGVAALYWLLTMGCLPHRVSERPTAPEGICAGEAAAYLLRKNADLPAMILQWAQLGYLTIQPTRKGQIWLEKKMDMGNERSTFEQRCFRDLFGVRMRLDATTRRFQDTCEKVVTGSRRKSYEYRLPPIMPLIFRVLSAGAGIFAGIAMGDSISTHHTWRLVIMAALGLVCFALSWFIQEGMGCLHLRGKAPLKLAALSAVIVLIAGILCHCALYAVAVVPWSLLAGLMAFYGGRRSDNGQRIRSELLGLRHYIRKADGAELQRILATNRSYFYELAPYALVFGLDKAFAAKFADARLPSCTWLIIPGENRTASTWYIHLRKVYQAMHRGRKPTLAERIFGK